MAVYYTLGSGINYNAAPDCSGAIFNDLKSVCFTEFCLFKCGVITDAIMIKITQLDVVKIGLRSKLL